MGEGKNVPVLRQSFSITSAAKIRRTAVLKGFFYSAYNLVLQRKFEIFAKNGQEISYVKEFLEMFLTF